MIRKFLLLLALPTSLLAQSSFTWGGSGPTATSGTTYSVVAESSGISSTNPSVTLEKNNNVVAVQDYTASYSGSDVVAASPVNFTASAVDNYNVPFSSTYTVTITKASMTPPTSSNYSIQGGSGWAPSVSCPSGNGTGSAMYCVAGYTNWIPTSQLWTPPASGGSYTFYVGQLGDSDHTGNNTDPNVGDIEVNGSGYAVAVASAPTISPVSPSVVVGTSQTFTASGGQGTGAYVWGGAASGTGSSVTVTFNTQGTSTVTVYKQGSGNYVNSPTATATVSVVADTTPPGPPGALSATGVTDTSFTVNWGASTDNIGVDHYVVEVKNPAGNVISATTKGLSAQVTPCSPNTTYTVYVCAVDAAGNASGWTSAPVTTSPDTTPPSVPGTPSVSASSDTSLSASWSGSTDDASGVAYYQLLVNGNISNPVYGLSAPVDNLGPGTTYSVAVRAVDGAGNASAWSSSASVTTPPDTQPPAQPQYLRASAISVTSFNLLWDPSTDDVGVTQYQVYENGSLLATTSSPSYQVSGLTTDTSYTFTVRAGDAAGNWSPQSSAVAFTTNTPVLVGIHAAGYGTATNQTFSLTSYEDTATSNVAANSPLAQSSSATGTGTATWTAVHQYRGFAPGVDNLVKVSGPSFQREIRFEVPAGYTLFINNAPYTNTATIDAGNANGASTDSAYFDFVLMPNDGTAALDAGYSIDPEVSIANVVWSMSLGRSPDGLSLGALTLRKSDISGDPMSIDLLKVTGAPDSVTQYSDGQLGGPWGAARRMIATPNCWVWLDDRVSGEPRNFVEIKVYDPSATPSWNGTTYVFNKSGSPINPFATYAISSNAPTNDTFTITKNKGQAQELTWTLNKATSGSTTTWTLQRAADRTLKMVETVSGNTTTEAITLTDGAGNVAQTFQKVYQMMPWGKRELMSQTDDPSGTDLVTSYTYGTSGGSYGKLLSVTNPDGTYTAYDYYSDDADYGNLWHTYSRWLDVASTAATASASNAKVVTYTYKPVYTFMADALDSTTTTVPGSSGPVTIAKTARNPDFRGDFNGHMARIETIDQYSDATDAPLITTRLSYHPAETANDLANRLISETAPNGTKISVVYYQGYFDTSGPQNGWIFEVNSNSALNTEWGEYVFHGFSTQVTGSYPVQLWDGQAIDKIYMVPDRSTVDLTVMANGKPTYTVKYVCTAVSGGTPTLEFLSSESLVVSTSVDSTGIATTTKTDSQSNGAQTQQTFINGRLMTETANDGSTITYNYDATGLLTRKDLSGAPASGNYAAQGVLYTHYTYDAASRKISEKTSDSSDPAVAGPTTTYHYDSAGRLDKETDPDGLSTSFSYDLVNHTTTTTLPGAFTKVVTTYADGTPKSVTGTAVVGEYHDVTVNADGTITRTTYALRSSDVANPTAAPRWTKETTDWLGRVTRDESPAPGGTVAKVYTYNSKGQLTHVKTVDGAAGTSLLADTVTDYNVYEMPYRTGMDLDGTGELETGSATDRIKETDTVYNKDGSGVWWLVTTTFVYNQPSSSTPVTTSTVKVRQNGFTGNVESDTQSFDVYNNKTETTVAVDRSNFLVTSTTVLPDSTSPVVTVTRNGLLQSSQSASNLVTTYAYDSLRREICVSDPRIDGTSLAKDLPARIGYYDGTAAVGEQYQKAWTKDTAGNQTTFTYSTTTGRLSSVQSPPIPNQAAKFTYYDYSSRGDTLRTWGAAAYPVEYAYDDYGEKIAMRTFRGTQDFTSATWPLSDDKDPSNPDPSTWTSGDITSWAYDPATGLLTSKTDAANHAVSYTYTELGQVKTKTWGRGVSITYKYYGDDSGDPQTGELKSADYSDTANTNPDVSYTYDRLGHVATVTDATGTRTFAYDPATTRLASETLPAFFGSRVLTEKYDATTVKGRNTGFSLGSSATPAADYDVTYGYDTYGRAGSVAAGGATFAYGYTPGSNLIATVSDAASGWTQTRTWDPRRDLLAKIDTSVGTTSKAAFAYTYDEWGRRKSVVRTGEMYSRYINQGLVTTWGYDDRSEVTSAQTYYGQSLTDLSYPVEGRSFGFSFDNIGNRLTSTIDGRATSYHTNNLNQITDRVTPGAVDVSGFAPTGSTVQVNGQAVDRQGDYFHAAAAVDNSTSAVNASLSITSTAPNQTIVRKHFLARNTLGATEQWQYDNDGNLTQDDQWTYSWDAENRLISMQTRSDLIGTVVSTADASRVEFTYDYLGRRAEKIVRTGWNGSVFATVASDTRFIYHGWNLVGELNWDAATSTFTLGRTYTWGVDLSGTLAGEGGTGGLLMTQDGSAQYLYAYDGNGNVSAVVDRSNGTTVAEYEYGAFGEPIRATGTYAQTNPFRFSTQYSDDETGLLYYGHRYYSPETGRFVGRDPTGETGGVNLYGICGNNPTNGWDVLGEDPSFGVDSTIIDGRVYTEDSNGNSYYNYGATTYGLEHSFGTDDGGAESMVSATLQSEAQTEASTQDQQNQDNQTLQRINKELEAGNSVKVINADGSSVVLNPGDVASLSDGSGNFSILRFGGSSQPSVGSFNDHMPDLNTSLSGSTTATDSGTTTSSGGTGSSLAVDSGTSSLSIATGNSSSGSVNTNSNGVTASTSIKAPNNTPMLSGGATSGGVSTGTSDTLGLPSSGGSGGGLSVSLSITAKANIPLVSSSVQYTPSTNTVNGGISLTPSFGTSGIIGPTITVTGPASGPTLGSAGATFRVYGPFAASVSISFTTVTVFGSDNVIWPKSLSLTLGPGYGASGTLNYPSGSINLLNASHNFDTGQGTSGGLLLPILKPGHNP